MRSLFVIGTLLSAALAANSGKTIVNPPALPNRKGNAAAPTSNQKNSNNKPALRRTRQATPRKLGEGDSAVVNLLNLPKEMLGNFLLGNNNFSGQGVHTVQNNVGDFVDKTRNVADSSIDTIEQFMSGFAGRGRNVLDRVTGRAADIVDSTVALGANSLGAGFQSARGLQGEAKRIAGQAASAAQGAVRAGEGAVAGAFERVVSSPQAGGFLGMDLGPPNAVSVLTRPLSSVLNLANSIA